MKSGINPEKMIDDLGYANGYNPELDAAMSTCEFNGHKAWRTYVSPSGNREKFECDICGFAYSIDMS